MDQDEWAEAGRPHWQCRLCRIVFVTIPQSDDFVCPLCKDQEVRMRVITKPDDPIRIEVLDEPGPLGEPNRSYQVWTKDTQTNQWEKAGRLDFEEPSRKNLVTGAPAPGKLGLTDEAVLQVLIDRFFFQRDKDTSIARTRLKEALFWLRELNKGV